MGTLRVIGAGFGRTGTMSLKVALEQLGLGPCHHALEVFDRPERAELWAAAARGEPVDWDEVLAGYRSTVDWPATAFYEQLVEAYPEAKVVLTVRDPDSWYESVAATIYGIHRPIESSPLPAPGEMPPELDWAREVIDRIVFVDTFDERFEDRRHAVEVFQRHNRQVTERVSPDRLLVYEVTEGWGPLCEFLELEPPDAPFPHLNDRKFFEDLVRARQAEAGMSPKDGREARTG